MTGDSDYCTNNLYKFRREPENLLRAVSVCVANGKNFHGGPGFDNILRNTREEKRFPEKYREPILSCCIYDTNNVRDHCIILNLSISFHILFYIFVIFKS